LLGTWFRTSNQPQDLKLGRSRDKARLAEEGEEDEETIAAELRIEFGLRMLGNRCYQLRKFSSGMQQELDAQLDHQKRKHPISLMGTYCLSLFLGFLPACCYYNCGETSIHFSELILLLLKDNV
jgi:hypothetical protein